MKIQYTIPATFQQGSCIIVGTETHFETAYMNALWEYNSMRNHDGLHPVQSLPIGTKSKIYE